MGYYAIDGWGRGQDGTISQTITTQPGQTYYLSFDVSKSGGSNVTPMLGVEAVNGMNTDLSGTVAIGPATRHAFSFIASSSSTMIRFSDQSLPAASNYDIDLDNVLITQ